MSKRKLLIHEVFNRIKKGSEKSTKGGLASDLANYLEEKLSFIISKRTLVRYYEAYIEGDEEIDIELYILNRLSQYLGFNDYEHFSTTIEKKGEDASKTTVKIDVDNNETFTEKLSNVIVNITNTNNNEQNFKMPEFIKQNGFGIMEMILLVCLVTGNVAFSNEKKIKSDLTIPFTLSSMESAIDKDYMYWNGERFIATDSSDLGPQIDVVPMKEYDFKYLQRITRSDTLTVDNALGKVWYDKSDGYVDFFTSFGINPENGKTLKEATDHMIIQYGAQNEQPILVEE